MVVNGDEWWWMVGYPLVNVYRKLWKNTLFIGKSTIPVDVFNSYVTYYQMAIWYWDDWFDDDDDDYDCD
jgi:hypothetical protein